ncbi:MAG: hypothetical protein JNK82_12560 [Myxococcaceae bacterium]|nr:hypothetical protein [Myxococcaceae bacterium]
MKRALLALLLTACLQQNTTVVGENDGMTDGGAAGGSTAGGNIAGGAAAGGGDTAGGANPSCGDIDVQPLVLDFGRVAYCPPPAMPAVVTRRISIRNVGCPGLHLGVMGVTGKNADSTSSQICVGVFDEATGTCTGTLPTSYDPLLGLDATGLSLPIRIQPSTPNLPLEWDVVLGSDDPDEPEVTVNVRAESVELPPCSFTVEPPALTFGLLQEPGEQTFTFHNTGSTECLVSWLDLAPDASPVFSLPEGPMSNLNVGGGQSLRVPVRARAPAGAGGTLQSHAGLVELFVSRPASSQVTVPLTAQSGKGCLYVSPKRIDFGERVCATKLRRVSVFNLCEQPVPVQWPMFSMLSRFPMVGTPPATLAPREGTSFEVGYQPNGPGLDLGATGFRATENSQLVDYVVPLSGQGVSLATHVDTWVQPAVPKADLLFVISNAPSMADDQTVITRLAMSFNSFFAYAAREGIDFQLGVLTTSVSAFDAGTLTGPHIVKPVTPNIEAAFASAVQVGTSGSATPQAAEVAVNALLASPGFLRPEASLAIIVITDAPDHSPLPAEYYTLRLRELRPRGLISYNVIGPEWPAGAGCPADEAWPTDSTLRAMTLAFEGGHASICAMGAAEGEHLEAIGATAFGYRTKFHLTEWAQPTSLALSVNRGDGQGFTSAEGYRDGGNGWSYDATSNAVVFPPLFVPAPGDTLRAQYLPACY